MKCIIDNNCSDGALRRGLCWKHYIKDVRYGDPLYGYDKTARKFRDEHTIPVLIKGVVKYYRVDKVDEYIKSRNWYADTMGSYAYTVDKGRKIYLHRYLLDAVKGKVVDHINNDRTDNRMPNLRLTDYKVNGMNRKIDTNSSTGVRGVYKQSNGKYYAKAGLDYKNYHLGTFDSVQEAKEAVLKFWEGVSKDGTPAV